MVKRLGLLVIAFLFTLVALAVPAHAATLVWEANPTADEVTAYTVHYGTEPGVYPNQADAGRNSWFALSDLGLAPGTYYVTVTATNTAGTSGPSNEAQFQVLGPLSVPGGVIIQVK